ncbi:integrase [Ralstonia sp. A12]|uniref:tyrosine-type recombinase/integrase n=1 Tax=Ralstonia sp. A12 TaxID=1217052 RepID=UPI00057582E4|nr:integrase arm-type DNA-binding domain-containing protein [Ralstonia sp. A12]KHK49418.1 integrase [Ralstonia sp. A12]
MYLTDVTVRQTRPSEKTQRLFDGNGLYLEVSPNGGKWWRLKYRIDGCEKRLSLGVYPDVTLKDARTRTIALREQIAKGIDPGHARKVAKHLGQLAAANSFQAIATEWFERFKSTWSDKHAENTWSRLKRFALPIIGRRPATTVEPSDVLAIIRKIEQRGTIETAHRVKIAIGQVMRYAVVTGRAQRDPTADLRGMLTPSMVKHLAAIVDPREVGGLLRAISGYPGSFPVACALQFMPMVFQRPGEVRLAEWSEFDFENATWQIPSARMKRAKKLKANGEDHIVPLSHQAVGLLQNLYRYTGHSRYLFPCIRSSGRPMSNATVNAALRRLGYDGETMTGHGFRAMARTILDEVLNVPPAIIEAQLAHVVKDTNGRAYNRTRFLQQRREMMQQWADYLDQLKGSE